MNVIAGKSKPIEICLDIGGEVTSISCGHIIVELIKFLAYQRLQIPYTYQWIKQVVNKRKLCDNEQKPLSFQSQSHYHTVSTALENLDLILKSILQEMNGSHLPNEVCIAFGGTPVALKEVYRLVLPALCHKPQCHSPQIASDQKIQRSVFRALVTSESLSQLFLEPLLPTNLYILVKKNNIKPATVSSDNFQYTSGYWIPRNAKIVVVNFNKNNSTPTQMTCCNEFTVFGDIINDSLGKLNIGEGKDDEYYFDLESTDQSKWYQSTYVMKGFKDSFVNGSSVMNSWLD